MIMLWCDCVVWIIKLIRYKFITKHKTMAGLTFDNQTLLYIIIALFIVNFFVMRWYVQSSIETSQHSNNKKLIKKLTDHIGSTFDQYMGANMKHQNRQETREDPRRRYNRHQRDVDSIDDPVDDIDHDDYEHDREHQDRDPRNDMRDHDNETDE